MTIYLLIVYAAIILVATAVVGIWSWRLTMHRRRMERMERLLSRRYMRIVTTVMLSDSSQPTRFPMLDCRGAKETLAKVLATVAQSVYGSDIETVGRIVSETGIDRWLLRQVQCCRGFDRVYYMSLLAVLPLSGDIIEQATEYAGDSNRFMRFYALLIRIGGDSSLALRALSEYDSPLTEFEIAEIMALLKRGLLPVSCEPLLTSANRNLQLVGINIAKEFGVEEVMPLLLEVAATDRDRVVAKEALYALVMMHTSLIHPKIANSIRHFVASERRSLCRCLAYEGYSASVLGYLLGDKEKSYAERLVATYKRRIVCTPRL